MKSKLTILFGLIIAFFNSTAQTNTWLGSTDGDWHKTCNWSLSILPTCSHDVLIPTSTIYPTISNVAHCNKIDITSPAADALTIQNSPARLDIGLGGSCSGSPYDAGGCAVPNVDTDCGGFRCDYFGACGGSTICYTFTNNTSGDVTLSFYDSGFYIASGGLPMAPGASRLVCRSTGLCRMFSSLSQIDWTSTDGSSGSINIEID